MLQFLTIVGAVLLAMIVYTVMVFAFMGSKLYKKMVTKMCKQMCEFDEVDDL